MDRQQLTDHVVQRLGELAGRNDIVREVCEKGQLHWADSEALVDEVLASQSQTIARRRYPIFLAISVVTLVAGFLLVVSTAVWLFEFLRPAMEEGGPLSLAMVFFVLGANGPLLEQALIGVAMIVGASSGCIGQRPRRDPAWCGSRPQGTSRRTQSERAGWTQAAAKLRASSPALSRRERL